MEQRGLRKYTRGSIDNIEDSENIEDRENIPEDRQIKLRQKERCMLDKGVVTVFD